MEFFPNIQSHKKDVLIELMEVLKALQETITIITIRKRSVDSLIKMMTKEKESEEVKADSEEEEAYASDSEEEEQPASN